MYYRVHATSDSTEDIIFSYREREVTAVAMFLSPRQETHKQ
jgi:hypothetical protein